MEIQSRVGKCLTHHWTKHCERTLHVSLSLVNRKVATKPICMCVDVKSTVDGSMNNMTIVGKLVFYRTLLIFQPVVMKLSIRPYQQSTLPQFVFVVEGNRSIRHREIQTFMDDSKRIHLD